jgi:ribosome-associated heat shock protein Hsp15
VRRWRLKVEESALVFVIGLVQGIPMEFRATTDAEGTVRLDKWLWSVRLYKTRVLATDACRLQRVRMGGSEAKASRLVRAGDVIEVRQEDVTRTVRVKEVLEQRVGAPLVGRYLEDLTPPEELEAARRRREERRLNSAISPAAKPSKRDRRALESFLDSVRTGKLAEEGGEFGD